MLTQQFTAADYAILTIPKYRQTFDIHVSRDPNTEETFAVVSKVDDIEIGKSFMCRLKYRHGVGFWYGRVKRVIGEKYRVIWIGDLP